MKYNFNILLAIPFIAFTTNLKAQIVGGSNIIDLTFIEYKKDFESNRYTDVKGLPFLLKDWANGSIKSSNNVEKKDLMLNFDEIRNELLIKGSNGKLLTVSPPAIEFTILDKDITRKFKLGYESTKSSNVNSFFEVLVDGKAQFLKRNRKGISENKEYSGNVVKSVTDDIRYYLVIANNEPVQVKLDQKSIISLLINKQTELNTYVTENKLNLKREDDVSKLINYYNTLN